MDVLHERCCGLDVHKKSVVACLLTPGVGGEAQKEVRTFGTVTQDVLALCDWLREAGCTHVAMESTGVYWKPLYNVMEGHFEVLVVNAQHVKTVPGRKTDVGDAEWIADLLQHGLLRGSFIPPAPQRELREFTRYRISLMQERARTINRLQKTLEGANIKLASVASDITGVSGRGMLEGLLAGQADPKVLAELARGRLRQKRGELERALTGLVQPHHRFLIAEHLSHLDYLDEAVERVNSQIEERVRPFQQEIEILDSITGVGERAAQALLAEMGADMGRFPDAAHLSSWAGVCPGNDQSAGKRRSGKTSKGNAWLRQILVEAAHGAARSKNTYLAAQYRHLARRRGKKKAEFAVAHSILVIAYHLLTRKEYYRDLGPNYYDERNRQYATRAAVCWLERLGYQVALAPLQKAA